MTIVHFSTWQALFLFLMCVPEEFVFLEGAISSNIQQCGNNSFD